MQNVIICDMVAERQTMLSGAVRMVALSPCVVFIAALERLGYDQQR
jgi:hypothetical protein